ncbi:hypothetical protein HDU76_010013, partial [Blyttiomyces sp. JEL0837]
FTITLLVSVILLCLGTIPSIIENTTNTHIFFYLNFISIIVFTIEFVIDCIIYRGDYISMMSNPVFIIDFLAIFPFYLEVLIAILLGHDVVKSSTAVTGLAALRVLRLFRVFRLFKVVERSAKLRLLGKALVTSTDGIVVFYAEQTEEYYKDGVWYYHNGDKSPFQSIPDAFWLTIVTLTTVGYGDVTPRTQPSQSQPLSSPNLSGPSSSSAGYLFSHRHSVGSMASTTANTGLGVAGESDTLSSVSSAGGTLVAGNNNTVGRASGKRVVAGNTGGAGFISNDGVLFPEEARIVEMRRDADGFVSLRIAVGGDEGFRKVLKAMAEIS